MQDIERFLVQLSNSQKTLCEKLWPGKVSIILPCVHEQFAYLHRGTNSLAFRMPKANWLRKLIAQTGPLVAPSANPEGLEPAKTIKEARAYFGSRVDGYYSRLFPRLGKPSTLVELRNEKVVVLRQGAAKIPLGLLA
jgi:L-threonylcarbamoyladenylate synthase